MQREPPVGAARRAHADYIERVVGHGDRRWSVRRLQRSAAVVGLRCLGSRRTSDRLSLAWTGGFDPDRASGSAWQSSPSHREVPPVEAVAQWIGYWPPKPYLAFRASNCNQLVVQFCVMTPFGSWHRAQMVKGSMVITLSSLLCVPRLCHAHRFRAAQVVSSEHCTCAMRGHHWRNAIRSGERPSQARLLGGGVVLTPCA